MLRRLHLCVPVVRRRHQQLLTSSSSSASSALLCSPVIDTRARTSLTVRGGGTEDFVLSWGVRKLLLWCIFFGFWIHFFAAPKRRDYMEARDKKYGEYYREYDRRIGWGEHHVVTEKDIMPDPPPPEEEPPKKEESKKWFGLF